MLFYLTFGPDSSLTVRSSWRTSASTALRCDRRPAPTSRGSEDPVLTGRALASRGILLWSKTGGALAACRVGACSTWPRSMLVGVCLAFDARPEQVRIVRRLMPAVCSQQGAH